MDIEGSTALITGGASGLGYATAQKLAGMGAQVVIVDLPDSGGAEAAASLESPGTFVAADVTNEEQVKEAVRVAQGIAPLRVVTNCAGVATPAKLLSKGSATALETFQRVIAINLLGTINVSVQASEAMAQNEPVDGERGVIVNTASVAAFEGQIGQIAYASSKAGVVGLTLPAARELAISQIRVMTIAPGLFETPMMKGLPQAVQDSLASKTPHPNRLGKAQEYADLVAHIVENPMLNGTTIRLDGAVRLEPR